jgi:PAS domain S-box-containing protein
MKRSPLAACCLAAALLGAWPAAGEQWRHRLYGVEDGLPSSEIHDIQQDAAGRLWLATRGGVADYDGLAWRDYGMAEGLSWADTAALRFTPSGELFCISERQPYNIFRARSGRFELMAVNDAPPRSAELTGFEVLPSIGDATPRLVMGTRDHGLYLFDEKGWHHLTDKDGLAGGRVSALAFYQGQLLVADGETLLRLDGDRLRPLPVSPPSAIGGMVVEKFSGAESLWLVGRDWVGRSHAAGLQDFEVLGRGLDFAWPAWPAPIALAADRLDGLYVGHADGLYTFHRGGGASRFHLLGGAESIQSLLVDREGILWVATGSDLVKLASRRFATWTRADGLFSDDVTAIHERRDGALAMGHRGGLTVHQDGRFKTRPLPTLAPNGRPERVRDITEDAAGDLWLAVDAAGLLRLSGEQLQAYGPAQGLDGTVTSVVLGGDGKIWVGTDHGAFRADGGPGALRFVRQGPELRIRRLFAARDGSVYVAAAEGLYQSGPEPWRSWTCELGEPCRSVFAVLETSSGGLLVGTGAGLSIPDKAPAAAHAGGKLLPLERPRIELPVFWLLESGGLYWAGTGDGVFRFDLEREPTHFTIRHGIAGREIHRGAGVRDRRGRIWIGTDRGATVYDPRFEPQEQVPPEARLLEVEGGDQVFSLRDGQPAAFASGNNDLIFRFHVLSLIDESRTQIRYRLAGLDADWRSLPTPLLQEARYYDLPSNEYVFELQAASADEVWGPVQRSALLKIDAPFFRQPWFFGLLALLALGALFVSQSFFAQRRYSRRLEGEVEARVADLRASEDRYRKTFRGIDDGILTSDGEGKVVLLNPRAQDLTGWRERDAVGKPVEEVLRLYSERGDEDTPLTPQNLEFRDSLGPGQTAMLVTRGGDKRLVELSAAPVSSGAAFGGLVFALRDVTRKRQMEEELARSQRLEAIGILAGGIAHDFNNLLTVLLGNLSLLRVTLPIQGELAHTMADAENALLRARDLTQQLLTFARGGSPVRKTAAIADILRDSSSFVLRGSKVRCDFELPEDLWPVEIDSGQMSQVINNLLINALQAMPSGGQVLVTGRNSEQNPEPLPPGRYVHIDIADQGVGIAEDQLPRIFDPYFTTKQDGRGLGLASAYSIVRRHDGLLTVKSKVGRGTTFSIYLPASKAEAKKTAPGQEAQETDFRGTGRALVMDDDAVVVRTAAALLEKLGYEVSRAADGREAIDRYSEAMRDGQKFVVVLMDLTVPGGMGGQQAIKRLQDLDPTVKAIVYSGYSNDPVLANYRDYGFVGRLSKPFRLQDLATALAEALGPSA